MNSTFKVTLFRNIAKLHTLLFHWTKSIHPKLGLLLYTRPHNKHFKFLTEKALVNGKPIVTNDVNSVVYFTLHKSASTFLKGIFKLFFESMGVVHVNFDAFFSLTDPARFRDFNNEEFLNRVFKPKGFFYGPFRSFREIPQIRKYKILFVVRDPRDILTSLYFSHAYSHSIMNVENLKNRKKAQEKAIDEFVLDEAENYKERIRAYIEHLTEGEHVLTIKYEDLITNFEGVLTQVSDFTGLKLESELKTKILEKADFSVEKEDKYSNKRTVSPGDYLNKLQPATIVSLNELFSYELSCFGYSK